MRKKASSPAKVALDHAQTVNPGSPFVISCSDFFKKKGFLSPKQIEALRSCKPPRHREIEDYEDDPNYHWDGGECGPDFGDLC